MLEMLAANYMFAMGGAIILLFLLYLMFAFPNYIPHVLVGTYFLLPLIYKLSGLKELPLTTVFTLLLGPIVLWRSRKTVLIYLWPVAIYFVIVFVLSFHNNINIIEYKSAFIPVIISILCMLSLSNVEKAPTQFRSLTYFIIGWVIVNAMFSLLQIVIGESFYLISATEVAGKVGESQMQRGYGLIGMATQVGVNFCLGIPLIGTFLFDEAGKRKYFQYFFFSLCCFGLVLSFSRGAILGVVISLLFLLFLRKKYKLLAIYLLLGCSLVFSYSAAMTYLPREYSQFFQGKDGSAEARLPYVQIGLRMFADRPLTGFGYGGFYEKCIHYGSLMKLEAHNTYIQVLVEYGILGLLSFLLMIVLSAKGYIGYIRKGRSPTLRTLGIGYFSAMIALTINALVHCIEWNLIFWLVIIFGFLMHHYRVVENQRVCVMSRNYE
jgi:hypothetical protein